MAANPAKRRKLGPAGETSLDHAISVAVRQPTSFVLETDELLKESRLDYDESFEGVDDLLRRIKSSIEAIEPHEPLPIADAAKRLKKAHKIRVPFPEPAPPRDSNYKLAYAKPDAFNVVGSYVSKTMVRAQEDRTVDMIVVLPREILQEKDYLNMRYYHKRAYYAAQIAAALQRETVKTASLGFEYLNDNPLLPVVAVITKKMSTKKSKKVNEEDPEANAQPQAEFKVRVIPCAPDGYFPKQKITAAAGLIRSGGDEDHKAVHSPTPFYNSTLKAEGSFVLYLRVLKQAEKTCASFRDACILGRIWLQQRGYGGAMSRGGFGHFEWSILMALLLQTGGRKDTAALSPSLNSTQLFKATIQYLAAMDFSKKPFILGQAKEAPDAIREAGPVVYDAARQLNIAYKMSASSADLLQQHAKWTRSILNDKLADQFTSTFITKVDQPALMYDLNASLELPDPYADSSPDPRGTLASFCTKVHSVLKRALGNRAQLVSVDTVALPAWPVTEHPAKAIESRVSIHIIFDPANVSRQVDHGPPAEDKKEAEKFRRFWGEKSELRRFKDGSILETLIWTSHTPAEICEEIMRYILPLHLKITSNSVGLTFYGSGFSSLVPSTQADSAAFSAARAAFEAFERDVRGLEDIPLHVRQIAPICVELRNATVNPPLFGTAKHAPKPMDVVIFFEASGKWPENIAAIQRAKIAFLLKIGSLLEEVKRDVTTHLGLEDTRSELENLAFLDVVYESGAAFRLRIHSDLEEVLLDRRTKDKSLDQQIRTESATLLSNFRRLYTQLPLHTTMIRTYTTRFPALSPTIRLLKRWFDAHKLTLHFPPDLLELFALHVFLQPHPWPQPSSATTGLLRVLLFLSRWDWRAEPLTIDTSSYSNPAPDADNSTAAPSTPLDPSAASTRLQAWRNLDPAMNRVVLLAVTASDPSGTAHTVLDGRPSPSKVVAARMTSLARSACRVVREQGVRIGAPPPDDVGRRLLFVPSLGDFDVRIVLDRKALKAAGRVWAGVEEDEEEGEAGAGAASSARRFKNLDARTGSMPLPVRTHPASLLVEQLSRVYAGPLVFFRGAEDDGVIGAVWNPLVQRRSFRVNLIGNYRPVGGDAADGDGDAEMKDNDAEGGGDGEDDVVEVDREAILAEIARIGGDLIQKIEVKGQ